MTTALILSGGTGTRMGTDIPKQYVEVCGKPIISYCIERFSRHLDIDAIHIVAAGAWQEKLEAWLGLADPGRKFRGFSLPGENRQLSILNGLRDLRSYTAEGDYVLIHDAARPLLSDGLVRGCLRAAAGHDGAIPVLPMKDTVYSSKDGARVTALLNRSEIYAGQAPEVFLAGKYYEANCRLLPDRILQVNGSTEAAILAGMDIVMIPGEEGNFKITTPADLERFRQVAGGGDGR